MSAGILLRELREDDLRDVIETFAGAFGRWPRVDTAASALDHLRWKGGDGWPGESRNYVAELDGQVVAAQLHQLWPVKVGDSELIALRGWDAGVHPKYQGRGIMGEMRPRMIEANAAKSDFLLGSTTHPRMTMLANRDARRSFAHPWVAFIRPVTTAGAAWAYKLRRDRSPAKLAGSARDVVRWAAIGLSEGLSRGQEGWTVRTVERFDERIDAFAVEATAPFAFVTARRGGILNWRYADPRAGRFEIRLVEEGERILGYAVLRVTEGRGYIADILALPARLDIVGALVRDGAQRLRSKGVDAVECWLPSNHTYVPALRRAGYLATRRRHTPTFLPIRASSDEMAFLCERRTAVHLTVGDMDFV